LQQEVTMTQGRKALIVSMVSGALVVLAASAVAQERAQAGAALPDPSLVERGEYLVTVAGCNDCHTPLKMGRQGPEPDLARQFSGHPSAMKLPPAPRPSGPWEVMGTPTLSAWSGPWGTSFAANLTSDKQTGIGNWTEQQFVDTLRRGRHLGVGRRLLPPMPWMWIGKATDEDLQSIFAYLKTTRPIRNRVPDPMPPAPLPGQMAAPP